MKLFKDKEYKNNSDITYKFLISSLLSIFVCISLLCLTTYAWFTSTISTSVETIKSSTYSLSYKIGDGDEIAISYDEDNYTSYTVSEDSVSIVLKALGTGTGYCVIKINEDIYYTDQITIDTSYTFTLDGANSYTITFIPCWGQLSSSIEGTKIENNSTLSLGTSLSLNEDGNAVANELEVNADTNNLDEDTTESSSEIVDTDTSIESNDNLIEDDGINETDIGTDTDSSDQEENIETSSEINNDVQQIDDDSILGQSDGLDASIEISDDDVVDSVK